MSDTAIQVEQLSKRYRIGVKETQSETMAGALTTWLKAPFQNFQNLRRLSQFSTNGHDADDILWAIKGVSFEVKHGEVIGIIGRNGAGKSTLLKILARITEPTSGRVTINGRVASLLEVGTGFHPDLTGRENIYLNGTVLGMRKREVDRKFDEIVAFSGVEKFIDTPVKRYSSGMHVRLAFAVAAHLEPEILLVDEVLAVGDVQFQAKCLQKMGDVARGGRTVLFVSHNLGAMNALTQRCMYFSSGQIRAFDQTNKVVTQYLTENTENQQSHLDDLETYRNDHSKKDLVKILKIWLNEHDYSDSSLTLIMGARLVIYIQIEVIRSVHNALLTIILKNFIGERVAVLFSQDQNFFISLPPGQHVITVHVEDLTLAPGRYFADIGINQSTKTVPYDVLLDLPIFQVISDGQVTHWPERPWGVVHCKNVVWQNIGEPVK